MPKTFLEYALDYVDRGLRVFPLAPRAKTPMGCLAPHGCKDATLDAEQIKKWWNAYPNCNIGIATGDGLGVIDVDRHGSDKAYEYIEQWEKDNTTLPYTLKANTGQDGNHILYWFDSNDLKNSTSSIGIDFRGQGGYIVAPPSIHPVTGKAYEWANNAEIAKADTTVLAFIESLKGEKKETNALVGTRYHLPEMITRGERNTELFKYAASLQGRGFSDDEIELQLTSAATKHCDPPLNVSEIKKLLDNVLNRYEKGTRHTWDTKSINKKELLINNLSNIKMVLNGVPALKDHFFYDTRAYHDKVILPLPWDKGTGERDLEDADYVQFRCWLENFKLPPNNELRFETLTSTNCVDAITIVSRDRKKDRLTEWLDSLAWDGEERIDRILTVFLGASYTPYTREVARLIFMGAVTRAYKPGTKFDYITVLVGAQGIGKSEFVKRLCPNVDWYLDNLSTMEGDGAIEKIQGKWIVEVAELANLRRDKIENVKAFTTQTNDTYRPKYGRQAQNRPRGCIFIGTTNAGTFLADTTGNRRWLPIECGVNKPALSLFDESAKNFINQCWAEAVHYYKTGQHTSLVISDKLRATVDKVRAGYATEDPRIGLIELYLTQRLSEYEHSTTTPSIEDPEIRVCTKEIVEKCLGDNYPKPYVYLEVKDIVSQFPQWQYVAKRLRCGEYGQQNFFMPTHLNNEEIF